MKFIDDGVRKVRVSEGLKSLTSLDALDSVKDPKHLTSGIIDTKSQVRKKGYVSMRLSEVDRSCAREWVIGNLKGSHCYDRVTFPQICVMDLGSALHHWLQNSNVYFGKNLVGYWKCYACGNKRRFGVKPTKPCEFCSSSPRATFYSEYMFRLTSPFRVVGKIDAIIKVGDVFRFVEIKSYGKPMTGPVGDHVSQAASYMYFSQFDESDTKLPIEIDRSVGYLMYFSKLFNYKAPVTTFPVRPTERLMKPIIKKVNDFTIGVNDGILPAALTACVSTGWNSGRAKKCDRATECKNYHTRGIERVGD